MITKGTETINIMSKVHNIMKSLSRTLSGVLTNKQKL